MDGPSSFDSVLAELRAAANQHATEHASEAEKWRRILVGLTLGAGLLAGVATFFAFRQEWSRAIGFGAGATFLLLLEALVRPDARRDDHQRAAGRYRAVRNEGDALATLEPLLPEDKRVRWLARLDRRRSNLDAEAPVGRPWWEWVTHVRGVGSGLVAVAAAALIGAGIGLAFTGSAAQEPRLPPQGPPPSSTDAALAARFAPVLKLSRDELFVPIDRARFVEVTRLLLKAKLRRAVPLPFDGREAGLPEARVCPRKRSCRLHLDIRDLKPKSGPFCYRRLQDEILAPAAPTPLPPDAKRCTLPTVPALVSKYAAPSIYWHVWRDSKGDDIAIQYWFLYLFNGFENWHEGDWEQITVRFEGGIAPREPEAVFYSAHQGGHFRTWRSMAKAAATHPVVFVARGSHANYFGSGAHPVELACLKKLHLFGASVCARVDDTADGCGPMLVPLRTAPFSADSAPDCSLTDDAAGKPIAYALAALGQPSFDGDYGFGNYLLHGRVPIGERGPEEPQRRSEWQDPIKAFSHAKPG